MDAERCCASIGSRLSSPWLAHRRRGGRWRVDVHLIQLIFLCARLREAKHRSQGTQVDAAAKQGEAAHPVWNRVLGKLPHEAPRRVEGDITTIGAPLLSADCHWGNAQTRIHAGCACQALRYNRGWAYPSISKRHRGASEAQIPPYQRRARPFSWLVFILFAPGATIPRRFAWKTWSRSLTTRSVRPCNRRTTSAAPLTSSGSSWDCLSYLTQRRVKTSIRARHTIFEPGANRAYCSRKMSRASLLTRSGSRC